MSFVKDLWQGFNCIKKEFISRRNNIKSLLYFISEQKDLEHEYAEGLSRLTLTKFNHLSNESSFGKAILTYINRAEKESKIRLDYLENIEENVINPLNNFINDQMKKLEILFKDNAKINKDFEQVLTNLSAIQNDFYSSIIISEVTLTKLTVAQANQSFDQLSQLTKMNDKKITIMKDYKKKYEDYVIEANHAREKFININSNILSSLEKMEYACIDFTKKCCLKHSEEIERKYESLLKLNNDNKKTYNQISGENDINQFIQTHKTNYSYPFEFVFIPYDINNILKSNNDPHLNNLEIKLEVSKILNNIISSKTPEENEEIEYDEKIKLIEERMITIWEGKEIDVYTKQSLDGFLSKAIYRKYILQIMDRFRVKGLFEINKKCFDMLGDMLNKIITFAIIDKDYTNINSCLIMSQTFAFDQQYLQNSIRGNKGLQLKETWIGLIQNLIDNELNTIKGYKDLLIENENERLNKINAIILGKLMTVCYNMNLLGISNYLVQEIIQDYSKMYQIKQDLLIQLQMNNNIEVINSEIHSISQDSINYSNETSK